MHVWLLHIGEDLPVDPAGRPFRYGYIADAVARRGGSTLMWAPTMRHTTKELRANSDRFIQANPSCDVQLVHAGTYSGHLSLRRVMVYRRLARRFEDLAPRRKRPDAIVAAIPSLEWAEAAVRFGRKCGAPVVVDVRDLWPDVFEAAAPRALRPIARRALAGYRRLARRACRDADALTAVSPSYLSWGLGHADRNPHEFDRVTPIGYELQEPDASTQDRLSGILSKRGFDPTAPTACFVGQFAWSSDVATVLDAVGRLQARGIRMQLLLCGDGQRRAALEHQAARLRDVHFLGWVDPPMITAVMRRCQIGIGAYGPDAKQSLPNKPFEYMAGRLAVVSSLRGDLERMLAESDAGVSYTPGDAEALTDALAGLALHPDRLERIRNNAHRIWKERFRTDAVYDDFVDYLGSLVESKQATAQVA